MHTADRVGPGRMGKKKPKSSHTSSATINAAIKRQTSLSDAASILSVRADTKQKKTITIKSVYVVFTVEKYMTLVNRNKFHSSKESMKN